MSGSRPGPTSLPTVLVAPAKLTLSLAIVGVRPDGLHLIDAEMVALDLHDTIELSGGCGVRYVGSAAPDAPLGTADLVARALALVEVEAAATVMKRIPAGAGLGGGSADAAAVLRWAGVDDGLLAASLGADVAFCLAGGRARVTGVGEIIEPMSFVARKVTLVTPPIHSSTPVVYRAWDELGGPHHESGNDLVPAALHAYPELARWRDELRDVSGQEPRLAGSGSTWFIDGHEPSLGTTASTVPAGWTPDVSADQ